MPAMPGESHAFTPPTCVVLIQVLIEAEPPRTDVSGAGVDGALVGGAEGAVAREFEGVGRPGLAGADADGGAFGAQGAVLHAAVGAGVDVPKD